MLTLENLHFAWPDGRAVLAGLSLEVHAGDKLVLLGANGCGKSTLLKLMNGLLTPQAGAVRFRGHPPRGRDFRRRCALLFQHPEAMLFNPTVRDEIAYGPRQLGLDDSEARVMRWAEALGLVALLDKPPYLLSGGEKQKVALAAVLALDPELLLLDEPSASLDAATVAWLIDLLYDTPATVVVATHNLSLAAELGSRCLVLGAGGHLLYDGAVAAALGDLDLLVKAGLAHRHRHRHGGLTQGHLEKPSRAGGGQGARSAATETYQVDRRGSEHRATQPSGRAAGYSRCPHDHWHGHDWEAGSGSR